MSNTTYQSKSQVRSLQSQFSRGILSGRTFASISLMAAFAAFTFLSSCKKDSANNDTTAVTDNAMAEGESNSIIQAVNSAADDNNVRSDEELDSILPPCAVVHVDTPMNGTKSITIDFGSTPCLCSSWDGKYREGKITATWTGMYRDSGTVISIQTDTDYHVGFVANALNKFQYLKTVTNEGHNANGNLHFAINVITAIITLPSGQLIVWNSQRDREWVAGESTLLPFDDKYSITGFASGTDRNGNPFTVNITSPIIVAAICPWIEQGTLEITHGNLPTATLDYGSGNCDDEATITVGGMTTTITLN